MSINKLFNNNVKYYLTIFLNVVYYALFVAIILFSIMKYMIYDTLKIVVNYNHVVQYIIIYSVIIIFLLEIKLNIIKLNKKEK